MAKGYYGLLSFASTGMSNFKESEEKGIPMVQKGLKLIKG